MVAKLSRHCDQAREMYSTAADDLGHVVAPLLGYEEATVRVRRGRLSIVVLVEGEVGAA